MIFPVMWFSEGIDGIDDEQTLQLLYTALFTPEKARNIMYAKPPNLSHRISLQLNLIGFDKIFLLD
jgi:hypothetical protein